jgi:hypothetical protein
VATEIERTQLGEGEAGFEAVQDLAVDSPMDTAIVVTLVIEGEAGFLKRRQIAADGASRDLELAGQRVNRRTVTGRLERMQDPPLADDLLISRHD